MHSTPDTVLPLHNLRQSELQTEASQARASRQVRAPFCPPRSIAAASDRLRVAIARASELVQASGSHRLAPPFRADAS